MARVSFGSRAGSMSDYNGGNVNVNVFSQPVATGPFDSLDALSEALKSVLNSAADNAAIQCSTVELRLSLNAVIPLVRPWIGPYAEGGDHDLPHEFKSGFFDTSTSEPSTEQGPQHPKAPVSAIINIVDPRGSQIVQRAASRGIQQVVEAIDGFRYSFNNAWAAKDGEGSRFSYICQDSMQNKDRHANGYTRVLKHLKDPNGAERGPRKPTYDCKGSISVKFSTNRQSCDVYYRHLAIHETVAARKGAVRTSSGGGRRTTTSWTKVPQGAAATMNNVRQVGGISATLQAEEYASSALAIAESPAPGTAATSNMSRPLKRKRTPPPPPPAPVNRNPSKPLSLADLLRQSDTAQTSAPSFEVEPPRFSNKPAPVAYDLPSWQTPPPSLTKAPSDLPYPLPYQPQRTQASQTPMSAKPATASQRAAMNATAPQQKVYQQFKLGAPSPNPPSAQGLFTTMKPTPNASAGSLPWPAESYNTPQHPPGPTQFAKYVAPRAKQSCTNCRFAKMRCDEGQPCGSCVKKGRGNECAYEQPRAAPAQATPLPNAAFQHQGQASNVAQGTSQSWSHPSGST
ncbi:Multidrug resistance regulator 1 [Pseudocercospora fuligena]|uniref:Multidrug resistance regulator 1 n=1 Tax=Pseudocercospora fuligena TaxID=685502 RepID=A0A8H6RMG7_9PEZI|nr:Multidrug resistance regulator 1 [Pseudocercospora fuligena]